MTTAGFAINFWAWTLLSPLGPLFKDSLGLSAFQQALLVAVPVIVRSLGCISVGALTDRLGGRLMFRPFPRLPSCRPQRHGLTALTDAIVLLTVALR